MVSNTWHCSVCMIVFRTRYPTYRNTKQNSLYVVTSWHHVKTLRQTQIVSVLEVYPLFHNQSSLSLSSSLLHGLSVSCSVPWGGWGIAVASGRTSWHMRRWPIYQFRIQRGHMVNERHGQFCLLTCIVNSLHFNDQPHWWRSPHRDTAKPLSLWTRAETSYRRVKSH